MANVNLKMLASGAVDPKSVSEHDFQLAVFRYAESTGWKIYTVKKTGFMGKSGKWQAMSQGGWPDMFMVRNGDQVVAELKREVGGKAGEPTAEQQEWLDCLALVPGCETFHWRPRDSKFILERLR